jgi:AraC-like DNA-binding protein
MTARDREIYFHTPGGRAAAFPYWVLAAGRSEAPAGARPIQRRYNQHVLILTLTGRGRIDLGQHSFECSPGMIAWLDTSRNYAHGCAASAPNWTYLWFGMRGFGLDVISGLIHARADPIVSQSSSERTVSQFESIICRLRSPGPDLVSANNAAVADVLAGIVTTLRPEEGALPEDQSLALTLRQVQADLGRAWSVAEFGRLLGLSPSQVHRRFMASVGTAPMEWLRRERINAAKLTLVQETMSIADIGARYGYPDPFHFSRVFRRIAGSSPKAFRRSHS